MLYSFGLDEILLSEDEGLSWSRIGEGPSKCPSILRLFVLTTPTGRLLVGTGAFSFHLLDCGGLFWTQDPDRGWIDSIASAPVQSFAGDPNDPARVFASSPAYGFAFFGSVGGVFETRDAGITWQDLRVPSGGAHQIVLSPFGETLYARSYGAVYAASIGLRRVAPPRQTRTLPPR